MASPPRERARSRARQERLARALKENLKRRREQARLRSAETRKKDHACNPSAQVPISRDGETG